jgi:DNA/RNA endonuclease YhcR with UshA esterase domain
MALQGDYIAAFDAAEHVGNTVTVCGNVASATYAVRSQGKPTFLNLDKAYPKHIFTAVIFDGYRFKFAYAPESLEGKDICVHGLVESYKGKPQIKVRSPDQIKIN